MKKFFVVHPTVWVKLVFWLATSTVKESFWNKLQYIHELKDIYSFFDPDQLKLPDHAFVYVVFSLFFFSSTLAPSSLVSFH